VRIKVGSLSLNGSIVADGASATYGSGSGGGIRLDVSALTGSGAIYARGGTNTSFGAGGGGRIALYYDTSTLPVANIVASGGQTGTGSNSTRNGGAGTIYLKDNAKTNGDLILDNRGIDSGENSTQIKSLGRAVIAIITHDSLVKNGASWISGALAGFKVNPNVNQKQFFTVKDNNPDTIFIDPADGNLNSVAAVGDTYSGVFAFNSLKVLGKSRVSCLEQLYVDTELVVDNSTLLTNEIYANRILLQNGGLLSHPSATTSNTYRLTLGVVTDLTIDATSKIDVSGRGYLGGGQGGNSGNIGMTFGNTATGGSVYYNGGSYGGLGGVSVWGGTVNNSYGNLNLPDESGSGGGGNLGGNGGGLVKITAGTLNLAGGIVADGSGTVTSYTGAGSGGGILVNAGDLSGNGTISVKGGSTASTNYGAGGGGRIAIYYHTNSLLPDNIIASGGKSGDGTIASRNGGNGTVHYSLLP